MTCNNVSAHNSLQQKPDLTHSAQLGAGVHIGRWNRPVRKTSMQAHITPDPSLRNLSPVSSRTLHRPHLLKYATLTKICHTVDPLSATRLVSQCPRTATAPSIPSQCTPHFPSCTLNAYTVQICSCMTGAFISHGSSTDLARPNDEMRLPTVVPQQRSRTTARLLHLITP